MLSCVKVRAGIGELELVSASEKVAQFVGDMDQCDLAFPTRSARGWSPAVGWTSGKIPKVLCMIGDYVIREIMQSLETSPQ